MSVPFQVYSDECEVIPSPQGEYYPENSGKSEKLSRNVRAVDNATPPLTERSALELWDPTTWQCIDG
jgi:hypothetical protein